MLHNILRLQARSRFFFLLVALLSLIAASPVLGADAQDNPAPLPKPKEKPLPGGQKDSTPLFRGMLLVDATGANYRDSIRLARFLEDVKHSPFADIVIQVRAYGDAYYDSQLVPRAYGVSEMINEKEKFDPLGKLIAECKSGPHPQQVFAWLTLFRVSNANRAIPEPPNHAAKAHPDWLSRNSKFKTEDEDGNSYLEPGLEEVQAHLEAVVAELAHKYALDGIVLDGLRYPGEGSDWGYHTQLVQQWRDKTGQADPPKPDDAEWRRARRENVDKCLTRLVRAAKQARPTIQVAAFALADGLPPAGPENFPATAIYQGALQDWPGWMKSKALDFVIVQNFRNEGEDALGFNAWNAFSAALSKQTGVEIVGAVAGFQNISLDALAQLRRTHDSGLMGVALSNYREPITDSGSRELFLRALSGTILAADSRRLPIPDVQVAAVEPHLPSAEEIAKAEAETQRKKEEEMKAAKAAEQAARPPEEVLDNLLKNAPKGFGSAYSQLVEPSSDAVEYLKKMYSNIF